MEDSMMKNDFLKLIAVFLLITLFSLQFPTYAQIVLDGSLGTAGQLKGPDYDIKSGYGQQAGVNLFHSFRDFNINTNESASFSGPGSVQNIISRVTGGSSWIDGKLSSTISGANLYLLNPAGVMFGANASLNIGGSFHVSTADYLHMGRNERFYATPMAGEVLSVASPAAFGFLDDNIAPVTFKGGEIQKEDRDSYPGGLKVPEGETISVVGGNIEIAGTYYISTETGSTELLGSLSAPGGRIDMAGVASEGEVVPTDSGLDVSSEKPGNITLDHALISVSGEGSGNIFISGGQFLANDSTIQADTKGAGHGGMTDIQADSLSLVRSRIFSDTYGTGKGGSIMLRVAESVSISDFSKIFADTTGEDSDAGDAGTVLIETGNLSLSGGGAVSSDTYGGGNGGTVTLRAAESVHISDPETKIFTGTEGYYLNPGEAGDAGMILIETPKLSLSDEGNISADTRDGGGRGGTIIISGPGGMPAESVEVSDNGRILSGSYVAYLEGGTVGDGGTVEINAKNVSFTDGGRIGSESDGNGRGGNIVLRAESLRFSGANEEGVASKAYTSALGKAPDAGDAGDILIEADHAVFENSGGVTASTEGPGNAGIIEMNISRLELDAGASVSSASENTGGGGDAGSIHIVAENSVSLNSHSSITTETVGHGSAGEITLDSPVIRMNNGSFISSASTSLTDAAGDAGTITIDTLDLFLENSSAITTRAENAGKGQITITAPGLHRMGDSEITTSIRRGGNDAGDIDISPPEWTIMNQSKIVANAWEGRGGNIHIATDHFIQSQDSLVDASSALGIDGSVQIESPDEDVSGGLTVLPASLLDATQWMRLPCAARSAEKVSSFVITGKDAVPTAFDDWQPSPLTWLGRPDTEDGLSGRTFLNLSSGMSGDREKEMFFPNWPCLWED
ncbi:MAG TPA: filamentous hemagglutinin N-terminal domain-containing protein [Desulfobacterales bacterium]|nr:filamentous hemagglutinin N-terminal domain-containing protein [Desulfobacterales bacterium]